MAGQQVFLPSDAARPCGSYDVVYVSPHLDDVAFSCAGHIAKQRREGRRVLVVTVFSRGDPARCMNAYSDYAPRFAEDVECMRLLGVDWYYADFEEMVFRSGTADKSRCLDLRLTMAFLAGWLCAPSDLRARLAACLEGVVRKTGATWLLGPAGMGFHPDHLLVHRACHQMKRKLPAVRVSFYHDWAYCLFAVLRAPRLWAPSLRGLRTEELRVEGDDMELKKQAIKVYKTQVAPLLGSGDLLKGERVADAWLEGDPHERFLDDDAA